MHARGGQLLAPQQRLRNGPSARFPLGRRSRALVAPVLAELSAKGRSFAAESISVKRILGEGSFGQCFEASSIFCPAVAGRRPQGAALTARARVRRGC
jgi:hypothetical protein